MEQGIVVDEGVFDGELRGGRRWRTSEQKRRIVEQTLQPGVSVATIAREHGINANQIFQWRRQYHCGTLTASEARAANLLPVVISEDATAEQGDEPEQSLSGSIHIEFPGRAMVTIEAGVDSVLASAVIERLVR